MEKISDNFSRLSFSVMENGERKLSGENKEGLIWNPLQKKKNKYRWSKLDFQLSCVLIGKHLCRENFCVSGKIDEHF